jgi:short-subunit dehydrogenase
MNSNRTSALQEEGAVQNRRALVTGASSGIGDVFANTLARHGYSLTCVARNEGKLEQMVQAMGKGHRYIVADLTDSDQLGVVSQDIEKTHYDLLINNAGAGIYDRFENVPLEDHERIITLNILALVRLSYAFVKGARAGDALINVSSALSRLSYPGGAVYCGSKGFVTTFTESLWYEYKDQGIYIMALLPGATDTAFHKTAMGGRHVGKPGEPYEKPEVVVDEAMQALRARSKPSLIAGPRIRFMTTMATRLMSRRKMVEIMGKRSMGLP